MTLSFSIYVLAAVALAGLGVWVVRNQLHRQRAYAVPRPVRRGALLSPNEREFLARIRTALPEFEVFSQVSLGAVLAIAEPESHPLFWASRATFDRKIADFVICKRDTTEVLCLLELDDRMHDFEKDAVRDDIPARAGIETLRFWSRNKPTAAVIRAKVLQLCNLPQAI